MTDDRKPLDVLIDIADSLHAILALIKAQLPKPLAPARDLDSKFGDPEIKFMPRDWTGVDYKGSRMSDCPAELLDMLAETFDYFADQSDVKNELTSAGKPIGPYRRRDAARARGWAKRKREGWAGVPREASTPGDEQFTHDDGFGAGGSGF
jgi:hypothetical protein